MSVHLEGTPCWADAMFGDVEGAKRFYAEVLGWTFGEEAERFGSYTQAYVDGKAVAGILPHRPGQDATSQWCLHLASADAGAAAARVREHGGTVVVEPTGFGDLGTMAVVREPGGAVFGLWQAGTHTGFEATAVPGAYCWAELLTRAPEKTDSFLGSVFPFGRGESDEAVGLRRFDLGREPVLGRLRMTADFPPDLPSYVNVYFAVDDCDAAVERAAALGAVPRFGPVDSPFGRFAAITDPQGAEFSVVDPATTAG